MGLETQFDNIDDLNADWPEDTDPFAEGAPQLRGIKSALQGNVEGNGIQTVLYAGSVDKPNGPAVIVAPGQVAIRDPAGGNPLLSLLNSLNAVIGELGHSPGKFVVRSDQPAQDLSIEYSTGAVKIGIVLNATTGAVDLYFAGVRVASTSAAGVQLLAAAPSMVFRNAADTVTFASLVAGAAALTLNCDAGDVVVNRAGEQRLSTTSAGMSVTGNAAASVLLTLLGSAGAQQARILGDTTALYLDATGVGAAVTLRSSAGAVILAAFSAAAGLQMQGRVIGGLADGVAATDAVTLQQLNAAIGAIGGSPVVAGANVNSAGTSVTNQLTARTLTCVKSTVGLYNWTLAAGPAIKQVQVNGNYTGAGSIVHNLAAAPGALTFATRLSLSATQLIDQPHWVVVY